MGAVCLIDEEVVRKTTQRIVDRFSPWKVIVFGSWARGEANADSDIDFLVVMPYVGSKRDWQVQIRRELRDFDVPKDVIVVSPEELERKGKLNGYVYRSALLEGKTLYERES